MPPMRAAALRRVSLGLLFLGASAASAGGGTGWTEVQTAHITVKSDLSVEDAREAALKVERTRAALLAAGWPGAEHLQPERVEVVVFATYEGFSHYFGRMPRGAFFHADPPTAFLFGKARSWDHQVYEGLEESTSVLKHELAHHLAAYFYRREPRWFSEGLAQYLETLVISEDGKTATLGEINFDAFSGYRLHKALGVADALAWSGKYQERDDSSISYLYGLSWLLVHWLSNTHPKDFARYQNLLIRGVAPDEAWKTVFGSLAMADIDDQLHRYSQDGDFKLHAVPIPPADGSTLVREMTSSEVHATRALTALGAASFHLNPAPSEADAKSELAAALADDAGNVRALRMKMGLVKPDERPSLGRLAVAAHPNDGLAWLTLGEALPQTAEHQDERARAYQQAARLAPDNPSALNHLAWMYVQQGQPAEALPLAISAVKMAPWNSAFLDTLSAALAGVHRCSEAITLEAQALELLPEGTSADRREMYTRQLSRLESHCSESPTSPAVPVGRTPVPQRTPP